jgi:predicted membrane-bound spermidine synthase
MIELKVQTLGGIFLISAATLCLELTLTRYFSISQDYHFAFLVISIAFLGYGASGSFLALLKNLEGSDPAKFLPLSSCLFACSVLLSFLLANRLPFDFNKLLWDNSQVLMIALYYLTFSLPFFFAGLTISFAIARMASSVNTLYFSDLLGAGVGSLLAVFIFLPRGERGVFILISSLGLMAALLFCPRGARVFKGILLLSLAGELALLAGLPSWMNFRISPFKALPLALKYPQAELLATRWDALSRIDILKTPASRYAPGLSLLYGGELPPQLGLSQDGGELSALTSFKGLDDASLRFLSCLPSSFAYSLVQNPKTLILGPKGGLDVLAALYFRSSRIKVVEENPLLLSLLRHSFSAACGNLYGYKNVEVLARNCRSALKQEKENYNLIIFPLTDVFGSGSTGLHGFGENHLFTIESFVQILDRLSPDGFACLSAYLLPPPRQEVRLLTTWIEALEKANKNPAVHLLAIRSWGTISLFIKKSPISSMDIEKLKSFAQGQLFDLIYYPGIHPEETDLHTKLGRPFYFDLVRRLLSPGSRKKFCDEYLFDIRPVTDDRPFFYNYYKPARLRDSYATLGKKWLPFLQGESLVPIILVQASIISGLLIFAPLLKLRKKYSIKPKRISIILCYFGLIGAAFIFIEISLLQKYILFLGHPLYSAAAVIFALLFSSGLGSLYSKRIFKVRPIRLLARILVACGGGVWLTTFLYPSIAGILISLPLVLKFGMTLAMIFPLGFLMGMPFPAGVRLLRHSDSNLIPMAWAANSFSTVVNSVLALGIAHRGGYNLVLALAGGSYLLASLFLGFSNHGHESNI